MKKILLSLIGTSFLISCTHLTYREKENLAILRNNGITIDKAGYYEAPNSPLAAGLLNILPGFGNFYLAMGAQTINKREMIYFYKSDPYGKNELRQKEIILN